MPHFIIQYSENLDDQVNMTELCAVMSKAMQQTGLFPLAGIRVRAHPMPHSSTADEHPNNAFADMILRMHHMVQAQGSRWLSCYCLETSQSALESPYCSKVL